MSTKHKKAKYSTATTKHVLLFLCRNLTRLHLQTLSRTNRKLKKELKTEKMK